jgi:hypothetical protein
VNYEPDYDLIEPDDEGDDDAGTEKRRETIRVLRHALRAQRRELRELRPLKQFIDNHKFDQTISRLGLDGLTQAQREATRKMLHAEGGDLTDERISALVDSVFGDQLHPDNESESA